MSITEHRIESETELISTLADDLEAELNEAVATRGSASMVVSGGKTPQPLFTELARRKIAWNKITITLADERWVDVSSKDSNEAMIRKTLLTGAAAEASFVPLKNSAASAREGQQACNRIIASLPRPFDVVILGMGEDGHSASLFPGITRRALDTGSSVSCLSVNPENAPHERMTLTASALLDSRKIVLHISGSKKWQIYQKAASAEFSDDYPVSVFLNQNQVPVCVYWNP